MFWISKIWSYGCVQRSQYCDWAMGWTARESWFIFFQWQEIFFSLLQSVHTGSGFHPAYPVGNGSSFPMGTMWSQHEADLSPSSSAEIRNTWICTSFSSCGFVMWCLIKYGITHFTFLCQSTHKLRMLTH